MKKKLIVLMLSMSMTAALVSGCGSTAETAVESTATETVQETATEAETADAESDQEAADKVAALIDQIYVQERNDNTDDQCAEAKACLLYTSKQPRLLCDFHQTCPKSQDPAHRNT